MKKYFLLILLLLLTSCQMGQEQNKNNGVFEDLLLREIPDYNATYYVEQQQSVGNKTTIITVEVLDWNVINYSQNSMLISGNPPTMLEQSQAYSNGSNPSIWNYCTLMRTFYDESGEVTSVEKSSCMDKLPYFITDHDLKTTLLEVLNGVEESEYYVFSLNKTEDQQCYVYYFMSIGRSNEESGVYCFATDTGLVSGVVNRLDISAPRYIQLYGFTLDRNVRQKGWSMIEPYWRS